MICACGYEKECYIWCGNGHETGRCPVENKPEAVSKAIKAVMEYIQTPVNINHYKANLNEIKAHKAIHDARTAVHNKQAISEAIWEGKPISDMTKAELVEALTKQSTLRRYSGS